MHAAFPSLRGATTDDDCAFTEIMRGDCFARVEVIGSFVGVGGFNADRIRNGDGQPLVVDTCAVPRTVKILVRLPET